MGNISTKFYSDRTKFIFLPFLVDFWPILPFRAKINVSHLASAGAHGHKALHQKFQVNISKNVGDMAESLAFSVR